MLDTQAFLYANTDTMNAPYVENSLPIEKIENINCAGLSTEIHSIENRHSVNTTDNTTIHASNDSIRPSLNTALRPAVIPIQPATTPSSGRPRCDRKRKIE